MELGDLPAGQTKTFKLKKEQGTTLREFVQKYGSQLSSRVHPTVSTAFGNSSRIDDLPNSPWPYPSFPTCRRTRGAWVSSLPRPALICHLWWTRATPFFWPGESDYSPIKPINQFPTRRSHKDTLWRMSVPVTIPSEQ